MIPMSSTTVPSGSDGHVQFNDLGMFGAVDNFRYDKATGTLIVDNDLTGNQYNLIRLNTEWGAALFNRGGGQNESSASLATPGQGGSFSGSASIARIAGSIAGEFQGSYSDGSYPGLFSFGELPIVGIGSYDVGAALFASGIDLYGGTYAILSGLSSAYCPGDLAGYFSNADQTLNAQLVNNSNNIGAQFQDTYAGLYVELLTRPSSRAAYFNDSFSTVELCTVHEITNQYGTFTVGKAFSAYWGDYGAAIVSPDDSAVGYFYDSSMSVKICDGTNALSAVGNIDSSTGFSVGAVAGYTGDLNDSTSTKIADVVGGIITGVVF